MQAATVPTVDIAAVDSDELTNTLIEWSCALVVGHGIPDELQQQMADVSTAFFDLPEEEKDKVRWPGKGMWEGWVPVYRGDSDIVDEGAVPNLVEWFQLQKFDGFDLWPAQPAEMREVWLSYFKACRDLASRIVDMIAESLELPADDVAAWTDRAFCNLAVNNYPPQPQRPLPGQVRLSAHTDENALTMLISRKDPGGLQVRKPGAAEDDWAPVTIPPNAVFIQPGDLLARWTNREIQANHHRVVNPPGEETATSRRQTIIFFHYPDWETVVTPAPTCVARTGEALPPLHVGQHILRNQDVYAAGDDEKRLDDAKV